MKKFIEEMRTKAEQVYNVRKQYFENKLRPAILESAENGDRITMVCVQGIHDARSFERYINEIGLKCNKVNRNESWWWYRVEF